MQKYLTWEKLNLVVIKLPNNFWEFGHDFILDVDDPSESSQELIKTDSTKANALVVM